MGQIGNRNLYLHKHITDDSSAFTTDTPSSMVNKLRKVDVTPSYAEAVLEGDDEVQERQSEVTSYKVSIELTDLTPDERSLLAGSSNIGNLKVLDSGASAPYFAISWQETLTDDEFQYNKLFKVKFDPTSFKSETKKEGSLTYQVFTITGVAIKRVYTGDSSGKRLFGCCIRSTDSNYVASIGSGWHNTGGLGTLDATAPTVSSTVPADGASSVALDSTVVWNFSLGINPTLVNSNNFIVFKESDDSVVAGNLTYDSDYDQITFTPSSDFNASSEYKAVVSTNVKTLAGTALASPHIISFTTTS